MYFAFIGDMQQQLQQASTKITEEDETVIQSSPLYTKISTKCSLTLTGHKLLIRKKV